MALDFIFKKFNELTPVELYEVLRMRTAVFIVEQNCVYQDIDNKDQLAYHILGYSNGELAAYARLFSKNNYLSNASIGRVIVAKKYRNQQYGHQLIQAAIKAINTIFNDDTIEISAQAHLINFYKQHGFIPIGEMYLEDNIPHIRMLMKEK